MAWRPSAREHASSLLAPELMARVQQIRIRTHRLVNTALAGGYRSTFRGQGIEFEEVRPYQPGDDVRSIDWNVTARTGEPFVKTYAEERELTLDLLVDTSETMDFGTRRWSKREAAAQIAALIGFVAIRHQDRVGLSLFGSEPGLHLPRRKGSKHVLRIIREVIATPPTPGASDATAALERLERTTRRRALVFLVSDFLGTLADERFSEVLARVARRNDVIAVRVFDPFEEELPAAGTFALQPIGRRGRIEVDSRSSAVREEWARQARERRERIERVLARARVDRIDLSIGGDLADPLVEFFRRREMRHGGGR